MEQPITFVKKNETSALDTACDLMWNYPIFNLQRGEFRSCCRTPPIRISADDLSVLGTEAFLNNPRIKQNRLDLINGVRTRDCISCWQLEDKKLKSPRHSSQQFWNHLLQRGQISSNTYSDELLLNRLSQVNSLEDPIISSYFPYMMEISLGNTCDMKCSYCNFHYSTQWAAEEIKLGRITQERYDAEFPKAPPDFDNKFWEWLNGLRYLPNRIGIIGGEPLIMPEFYTFIEKLTAVIHDHPKRKRFILWIVTNFNTPPNYIRKFLEYLPSLTEAFDVEILVSLESVGKRAEYIRNGLKWDRLVNNLDQLLSIKNCKFEFGFLPSLNALSISTIKEFVIFCEDIYRKYKKPVCIKQNQISFPNQLSTNILTSDFADYIDECIRYMRTVTDMPPVKDPMGTWENFFSFIGPIAESIRNDTVDKIELRRKFAAWADDFDVRRNLKFTEVFPEYTNFYNLCKGS